MRCLLLLSTVALLGCAARLSVVGPYAGHLTQADIRDITAFITPHRDVSHLYTTLDVVRPDRVRVTTGGYVHNFRGTDDTASNTFTAIKRRGRWTTTGEAEGERTVTVF